MFISIEEEEAVMVTKTRDGVGTPPGHTQRGQGSPLRPQTEDGGRGVRGGAGGGGEGGDI